jgi:hypothetical protein
MMQWRTFRRDESSHPESGSPPYRSRQDISHANTEHTYYLTTARSIRSLPFYTTRDSDTVANNLMILINSVSNTYVKSPSMA